MKRKEVSKMPGISFSEQDNYLKSNPPGPILTDQLLQDLAEHREAARNTRPEQIHAVLRVLHWAGMAAATGGTVTGQPWGPVALQVLAQVKPLLDGIDPGGTVNGRLGMVDPKLFASTIAEIYRLIKEAREDND